MATGLGSSRNAFFMQKKAPIFFRPITRRWCAGIFGGRGHGRDNFRHVSCFVRRCSVKHRNFSARLFILKKMFKKSSFKCQKHIWNNVYQFLFNAKKTPKNTKMHLYTHFLHSHFYTLTLLQTRVITHLPRFGFCHVASLHISRSFHFPDHIFATQNNPLNFVPPLHEFIWLSDVCFQINGF